MKGTDLDLLKHELAHALVGLHFGAAAVKVQWDGPDRMITNPVVADGTTPDQARDLIACMTVAGEAYTTRVRTDHDQAWRETLEDDYGYDLAAMRAEIVPLARRLLAAVTDEDLEAMLGELAARGALEFTREPLH